LGSIDEKYDVAVSTACDLLDCIVVDTIDTAESCVEKLKEQQVGFATFIALDLQDKFRECLNKKMSTPDDMPRLVELIKVNDPKLLTVFYFSLRDTLVATDLNQAMKIYDVSNQSQRYRVVTLTGEKIEISGTLSGGGRPIRGRMGNNILNDEYTDEKIKETLDKDQELQDTYILKHQLESAFNVLINKLENLKESRFRMNHKGMILNKNLNSLNQNEINISEKISEMIVDAEERKKLEQTAEINRLEYLNALEKASQAKNKNDELAREIFKIRTTIIGDQKENVRKIEEDINIKNKIIIDTKFNIQSTKRNLERSEKNLSNFSIDIKQNEKNLEKNKEDYKNLKAISKELKSNIKNEFEINNIECLKILEINDITNKNCIDIIHNSSKKLINLTNQLMEVKTLIKINQNDLDGILTEIKKLKSNDIEYFEGLRPDFHQFDKKNLDTIDLDELNKSIVKLKEDLSHENPNSACIYKEQVYHFVILL
jgi:structural maintenance of chromosome 4